MLGRATWRWAFTVTIRSSDRKGQGITVPNSRLGRRSTAPLLCLFFLNRPQPRPSDCVATQFAPVPLCWNPSFSFSLSLSFSSCLSADFFSLAVFPFVSSRPQYFGKTHPYTYTHRRKDGVGRNETNGSRRWNSNCRGRASAQFGGEYRLRYDFSDDYDYNGSGRVHVLPHHRCGYYTTSDVHTHTQTHTHVGARSFSRQSRILLGRTSVRLLVHGHVTWPSRDINKTKAISMWYQQDNNIGRETQDTLRARSRARWSRDDRERAASRRNIRALQS